MPNLKQAVVLAQRELAAAVKKLVAGEISGAEFKHTGAPSGIYQQSNDAFMVRVRLTGGVISPAQLRLLAELSKTAAPDAYLHITTRQDIQLHNIPAQSLVPIVKACCKNGLPFRGGGGDTVRNTIACPHSGLAADSVFDVLPITLALNEFLLNQDLAFTLPRKFKIGFFAAAAELPAAQAQDLGFMAAVRDGVNGFTVYGGGGMGRHSRTGIRLLDFVPAAQTAAVAMAALALFNDHGDREHRQQARLRFVLDRLGDKAFLELFRKYLDKAAATPALQPAPLPALNKTVAPPTATAAGEPPALWQTLAVIPNHGSAAGTVRVKLFVPNGNLPVAAALKIAEAAAALGCTQLRTSQTQDIWLPALFRAQLGQLYAALQNITPDLTATESMSGLLTTCVGAGVCRIGILDAPGWARKLEVALDSFFRKKPELKAGLLPEILAAVRISGCPNSCAAQQLAALGFAGAKRKLDGVSTEIFSVFVGTENEGSDKACLAQTAGFVRADELSKFILKIVRAYLKPRKKTLSLRDFIRQTVSTDVSDHG